MLSDRLQLKRLEFLEMNDAGTQGEDVDPAEQFDIDFAVMAGELSSLLRDLSAALGSQPAAAKCGPARLTETSLSEA